MHGTMYIFSHTVSLCLLFVCFSEKEADAYYIPEGPGIYASKVKSVSHQVENSAVHILGKPDKVSWQPTTKNVGFEEEYIEIEYMGKMPIRYIEVHVTVGDEYVSKVGVHDGEGFVTVYMYNASSKAVLHSPGLFRTIPIFIDKPITSNVVRIETDCSVANIDAVRISEFSEYYGTGIKSFSHSSTDSKNSVYQILGFKDSSYWMLPGLSQSEFVEIEFGLKVDIGSITLSTFNYDAITKVSVHDGNSFVTVYEAKNLIGDSAYFPELLLYLEQPINSNLVRIEMDPSRDAKKDSYHDAITISGYPPDYYATSVKSFSSFIKTSNNLDHAPSNILGPRNYRSWFAKDKSKQEFIEVEFPKKIVIRFIEIDITINSQFTLSVHDGNSFVKVYTLPTIVPHRRSHIPVYLEKHIMSNLVRVDIPDIDRIFGVDFIRISEYPDYYVTKVKSFSGVKDVKNVIGYHDTNSPSSCYFHHGVKGFIEVEFFEKIDIQYIELDVYKGFERVNKISVYDETSDKFVTVYQPLYKKQEVRIPFLKKDTIYIEQPIHSNLVRVDVDDTDRITMHLNSIRIIRKGGTAGIQCGVLSDIANGFVSTTGTGVGDTATFTCNGGYKLSGSGILTCQSSGEWSGSSPTCESPCKSID